MADAAGSPTQEPSLGRLACFIPGFLIVVAIAVGGGLVFINCLRASPATSYSTRLDRLPPEEPVYLSGPGIYLVRLQDEVIALSQYEPPRPDSSSTCTIRWREALEHAGGRGLFRSDCTGALYQRDGTPIEGSVPPMRRHLVKRDGEKVKVTVDFKTCIDPQQASARIPCRSM